jgi:hypothetical protein
MKIVSQIFAASSLLLACATAQADALVTEAEAKLPNAPGIATRGVTRGPGIKMVSPDPSSGTVKSPFDLKVGFEARGGAKIDPSSVKVHYMKSPLVDLTDRIKDGIKGEGIDFSRAELSAGEHAIRFTVKDSEGRSTSSVMTVNVVKN